MDVIILMDRVERKLLTHANVKGVDQPSHPRSLISAFVVRSLESTMDKLATRQIPAFWPISVTE